MLVRERGGRRSVSKGGTCGLFPHSFGRGGDATREKNMRRSEPNSKKLVLETRDDALKECEGGQQKLGKKVLRGIPLQNHRFLPLSLRVRWRSNKGENSPSVMGSYLLYICADREKLEPPPEKRS